MTEKEQKQARTDDHVVFIGGKPFMNYVTGVIMQFTTQGADEVVIKGRGKFITRCVDVAEVATKRFLQGQIEVKDVRLDSEEFKNKEGRDVRVSTIEITLTRK
ncbi:MAG: DNA-binding protein Alba [Nanoarchaeota archaeon]